jgi:hypothetical protein
VAVIVEWDGLPVFFVIFIDSFMDVFTHVRDVDVCM